jgi:hypothetical protein
MYFLSSCIEEWIQNFMGTEPEFKSDQLCYQCANSLGPLKEDEENVIRVPTELTLNN